MWFNPIIKWLLRSPLHGFVSKNILLMTYKGRKSGKEYSTPMNYVRLENDTGRYLLTLSSRDRVWWRNLRGGSPVILRLQGHDYQAHASVVEDTELVISELSAYLRTYPEHARYFGIQLSPDNLPDLDAIKKQAEMRVVIRTHLDPAEM